MNHDVHWLHRGTGPLLISFPLAETPLSTFLAADKDHTDDAPEAFLSGVITDAQATRVLFEGQRAVGVEYRQGGALKQLRASREVLL